MNPSTNLILALLATACSASQCSPAHPTILIDEAHYQVERPGKAPPTAYDIPPGQGLIVDTTQFTFLPNPELGIQKPNLMQLVVSKDEIYAADFHADKYKHPLNVSTLQPLKDGIRFTGFQSGQQMILAIGSVKQTKDESGPEGLRVMWVGLINVVESKK